MIGVVIYCVAFIGFIILYELHKHELKKAAITQNNLLNSITEPQSADIIGKTSDKRLPTIPNTKSFDNLKEEIRSLFHFSQLHIIFGIDYTASNEWHGRKSFNGQMLHKIHGNKIYNPYQKVISQLGSLVEDIFSIVKYYCFGFGDQDTKNFAVFPIIGSGEEIVKHQFVLDAYLQTTKTISLSGPTCYAPIISKLIDSAVRNMQAFMMLIIVADSSVDLNDILMISTLQTLSNISNACVVLIGIGDGPWHEMAKIEHRIRELCLKSPTMAAITNKKEQNPLSSTNSVIYDNFHFVDYNKIANAHQRTNIAMDKELAKAVFKKFITQLKQTRLKFQQQGQVE